MITAHTGHTGQHMIYLKASTLVLLQHGRASGNSFARVPASAKVPLQSDRSVCIRRSFTWRTLPARAPEKCVSSSWLKYHTCEEVKSLPLRS
eukprot:6458050-Amphidinium_carterae.1